MLHSSRRWSAAYRVRVSSDDGPKSGARAGVALTYECELGYTLDPAVWGQGFATEGGGLRSRLRARHPAAVVRGLGHSSAQRPLAARRRTARRARRRPNGSRRCPVGSLRVVTRHRCLLAHLAQLELHATPHTAEINGHHAVKVFSGSVSGFRNNVLNAGIAFGRLDAAYNTATACSTIAST